MRVVGIDVGSRRLDAVALDGDARVVEAQAFAAVDVAGVVDWVGAAAAVCVDSPDRPSTAPHAGDMTLPPKFRTARCAEIGLGRHFGVWVPWTTPERPTPGSWIAVGIALFDALRGAGHEPVEVYPHAAFRVLNGGRRPAKKQTPAGIEVRVSLLVAAGVGGASLATWGHDALDAAAAALVALDHATGRAVAATCGHDGSAIWLPASAAGVAEPSSSPVGPR